MDEIRIKIRLENGGDIFLYETGKIGREAIRYVDVDTMIDTGAVMLLLPQNLVEVMGIKKIDRAIVTLANDER